MIGNCRLCKNPGCVMRGSDYTPNPAIDCFGYEPMSRADQLRAMTDEELADAFVGLAHGFIDRIPTSLLAYQERIMLKLLATSFREEWLDGLKQEATCNAETETTNCKSGGDAGQ